MSRKARSNPLLLTDIELDLMRCIWDRGQVSASEVQMEQVRNGKETAYTTVKTMLDRLVQSGVCQAKELKGRYYYSAKVPREEVASEWYRHLSEKIFGDKAKNTQLQKALQKVRKK